MSRIKIVADDKIPFLKGVLEPFAEVVFMPGSAIKNSDIKNADAMLIRTRTKCTENLLKNTTVKFIATATIGFDHIDSVWCEANGITWTNAPGCNSWSVHQYIASALVTLASKKNCSLVGKTLGVIGAGHVGTKIISLGNALGMKVLVNDPPRERIEGNKEFCDLSFLLQHADIITLHVPLNKTGEDKTFHLVDDQFLMKVKQGVWLINASRGEVIQTEALLKAIRERKTGAVVLDVWENEPEINRELLGIADIATPHIAGYSIDGKALGTAMSVRSLAKFFKLPSLLDWFPKDLPLPVSPEIIGLEGKESEQVVFEAINHCYTVLSDDERLRKSPETFEKQRGNYPPRREFGSYSIRLETKNDLMKRLKQIGFRITE